MTRTQHESDYAMSSTTLAPGAADVQTLRDELQTAQDNRRRAECMAAIQTDAVQLALDLLVREPDVNGFFREFMARVVDETESHGCGVWLRISTLTRPGGPRRSSTAARTRGCRRTSTRSIASTGSSRSSSRRWRCRHDRSDG